MESRSPEQDELRQIAIDVALGQAAPAQEQRLRAALRSSPALLRELEGLESTVGFLRAAPEIRPSARFRQRLERRLDRIDAESQRAGGLARAGEELVFRTLLLGYRLRTSSSLRWQLAAALVLLAAGLVLAGRASRPASVHPLLAPEGVEVADARPRTGENRTLRLDPPAPDPGRVLVGASEQPESRALRPGLEEPADPTLASSDELLAEPDHSGSASGATALELDASASRWAEQDRALWEREASTDLPSGTPPGRSLVDRAVDRGLRWLQHQQRADGSWGARDGEPDLQVGVTALAMLAFLRHESALVANDPRRRVVDRGVEYLLSQQGSDGCFGRSADLSITRFNHATSCLVLLERFLQQREEGRDVAVQAREFDAIRHALDHLEIVLLQLFHRSSGHSRCDGQNAAWASLALATATRSGLDLGLSAFTQARVGEVLRRLRHGRSASEGAAVVATMRTVQTMLEGEPADFAEDGWAEVVERIVADPVEQEPSLRFLVATALCPPSSPEATRAGRRQRLWTDFYRNYRDALLRRQHPRSGVFSPNLRWYCFDGGDVYETSLAVLALGVPRSGG